MKFKKQIEALQLAVTTIPWPTEPDTEFNRFVTRLREAVRENLGYEEARSLRYVPAGMCCATWEHGRKCNYCGRSYRSEFEFDVERVTAIGNHRVSVKRTFEIFPRLPGHPLLFQLEVLKEQIRDFEVTCAQAWDDYKEKSASTDKKKEVSK